MDQSNLHMHARETSEVLPSISADAVTVTTPLDRKVQQTAQSVPLSSITSVRPQLLKARELGHAKSMASRPDRARASVILKKTLPSTLAAGRSKTETSTAKTAHPAPLQRPVSLSRATATKSSTRMETKTATVGSQAKSVAASTKPTASQAPSEVSLRTRKARGLDFSTPSPHAQLQETLRSDSITSHPFKPEAGGNGTTRFLGELVVKGDDRASCEREILFGQTLRTFGVETPQAVAIDKSTLESLRSAVSEYDELFAENEPGSIEIILMPQVKGTSFEQCVQQPNLVEKLRRVAPNMMEKIGHIAAIDMLLSNNDRLVHVNRETRELQELNLVNLGNLMFTIEHGEIAVPVAIDNGGYNSFEKEEQRELDISQFLYHLDHPEKVAEHIMRGLARDIVWGTLSKTMQKATLFEKVSIDLGFSSLTDLTDALKSRTNIQQIYEQIVQIKIKEDEDPSPLATTEEEQLAAIVDFLGFTSLESCEEALSKMAIQKNELQPYFEGPFSVLAGPTQDMDPDLIPLQIEFLANYLGMASPEEMKAALVKGLLQGKSAMMTTDARAFFERTTAEHADFKPDSLDQFQHIAVKIERLQTTGR